MEESNAATPSAKLQAKTVLQAKTPKGAKAYKKAKMSNDDFDMESTSSGASVGDDVLFPGTHAHDGDFPRAQTPQNDHLNASAPGELSPPRSHSATHADASDTGPTHFPVNGRLGAELYENDKKKSKGKDSEWKPGAWKTKRAMEDYERASEHVVDRDFDITQFSDPLLEGGYHGKSVTQILASRGFDMGIPGEFMRSIPGESALKKSGPSGAAEEKPKSG